MYVIRETFMAKPGMASKLANLLSEVVSIQGEAKTRVLTDLVGPFNTVVMETEVADFGDFQVRMKEYSERKDIQEGMKGYTDMYVAGTREIYQVI